VEQETKNGSQFGVGLPNKTHWVKK